MTESRQVVRAEVAMLAVVLIWGANFSFMKMALGEMSGLAFAGLRFTLAACILLAVLQWREGSVGAPREAWWPLAWMGVLSNTLYQVCFMYGLTHTSVANASLIVATTPLIVAFLGAATGIEALRRPVVTGGLLGFSGVALILAGIGIASAGGRRHNIHVALGQYVVPLRHRALTYHVVVTHLLDVQRRGWREETNGEW